MNCELIVAGIKRKYRLYRPKMQETKGMPLMIVLHGGQGNAERMEARTGMNDVADAGKFVVAYPEGTGGMLASMENRRTWNAGRCCGHAAMRNVDDVLFLRKLIDELHVQYAVDDRRVYVTGISNGAMMAYRLACEIPDKIAAIIPVSGTLAVDNCDAAKDVPILHIHGDQDTKIPFEGGNGGEGVSRVAHRSVQETINLLIRPRGCDAPKQDAVHDRIIAYSYRGTHGAPVTLYVIKGGGHVWPGGNAHDDRNSDSQTISASRVVWEFARQFSKNNEYNIPNQNEMSWTGKA